MNEKTSLNVVVLENKELNTLIAAIQAILVMADEVEDIHDVNVISRLRTILSKLEKQYNKQDEHT